MNRAVRAEMGKMALCRLLKTKSGGCVPIVHLCSQADTQRVAQQVARGQLFP
jgi:hypothetical protein